MDRVKYITSVWQKRRLNDDQLSQKILRMRRNKYDECMYIEVCNLYRGGITKSVPILLASLHDYASGRGEILVCLHFVDGKHVWTVGKNYCGINRVCIYRAIEVVYELPIKRNSHVMSVHLHIDGHYVSATNVINHVLLIDRLLDLSRDPRFCELYNNRSENYWVLEGVIEVGGHGICLLLRFQRAQWVHEGLLKI